MPVAIFLCAISSAIELHKVTRGVTSELFSHQGGQANIAIYAIA